MTNRRRGGKTRKKTPAQRRHHQAVEEQANRIRTIPRPRMNMLSQAIKVELIAAESEARRDGQK